jgi:hypothetical protein
MKHLILPLAGVLVFILTFVAGAYQYKNPWMAVFGILFGSWVGAAMIMEEKS